MKNERGSILIITVGFVLVFTLLGFAAIYLATVENEAAVKRIDSTKAFWLAEAGIQKTLWEFKKNSCHGLFQKSGSSCSTTACADCKCANHDKCFSTTLTGIDTNGNVYSGDYDITLNDLNANLISIGSFPSRVALHLSQRKIQLNSGSPFQFAFFARHNITIDNNSSTDSYDSSLGNYGGSNIDNNAGNIGSNDTVTNTIVILNATINGSVSTGPKASGVVDTVNNGGVIGVLPVTYTNDFPLPSVIVPSALVSMAPTGGTITNDTTLGVSSESHDYKYTDINLGTNKTVTFNGTVRLYLTSSTTAFQVNSNFKFVVSSGSSVAIYTNGKVNLTNNGDVNNPFISPASNGKPITFQIFSTYSGVNGMQIANNGSFYGTIYAPDTDIIVGANSGNSKFFGAMVGNNIHENNNTPMHYDKTLADDINSVKRTWHELGI